MSRHNYSESLPWEWARSGVYAVDVQTPDGVLVYVGASHNMRTRWRGHLAKLRQGKNPIKPLQRIFDEVGEPKFSFRVLEYCVESDLPERELHWIEFLEPALNSSKRTARSTGWEYQDDSILNGETPPWDPYEAAREEWREINKFNPVGLCFVDEVSKNWGKLARQKD